MMIPEAVDIVWEGGEHSFFLGIGELRALQSATDAGPMWVLNRLNRGDWLVDDIYHTVRLGLIGGGMGTKDAKKLVDEHIGTKRGGLYKHVILAASILAYSILVEDEDDPVGKPEAGMSEKPPREEK